MRLFGRPWWVRWQMTAFMALLTALLLLDAGLEARAGGGGGGGGGGGRAKGVAYLVVMVYWAVRALFEMWAERRAAGPLAEAGAQDEAWGSNALKGGVREAFFALQKAWEERDQDLAADYMTPRLYKEHKALTDSMLKKHEKNVLSGIQLKRVRIVEVRDYQEDAKDSFVALMHGSMVDYAVDDRSGKVLRGDADKAEEFKELWTFVRSGDSWRVDAIDSSASIADLVGMSSMREAARSKKRAR